MHATFGKAHVVFILLFCLPNTLIWYFFDIFTFYVLGSDVIINKKIPMAIFDIFKNQLEYPYKMAGKIPMTVIEQWLRTFAVSYIISSFSIYMCFHTN